MKMCVVKYGTLLSVLFVFSSCSVKSDRLQCPSLLFLSVFGGDEPSVSVNLSADEYDKTMHITQSEGVATVGLDLNRGEEYGLLCYSGITNQWGGLIPLGEQMPRLYALADTIVCLSDVKTYKAHLCKQFSKVYITVKGLECNSRLRSNVCGVDLNRLKPVQGQFCVEGMPTLNDDKSSYLFSFSIPRQLDKSLVLELVVNSKVVYKVELGKELHENGWDWNKQSLDDIYISIEYIENDFSISVQNWLQIEL